MEGDYIMKDIIDSIDATIQEIAAATFWGFIKSIVRKVKLILLLEREYEAAQVIDILFE